MSETTGYSNTAILLLAFGGPDSLESVEPFLKSVLHGRPVSKEQIDRAIARYKAIGGRSPLLDITRRQAQALEDSLRNEYPELTVYVGMRHWHPFIKDILEEMVRDGIKRVVAVSMAPHNSKASTGGYIRAVEDALNGLNVKPEVTFVRSWHNHPQFIRALSNRIEEGLARFRRKDDLHIIFSAHSLPEKMVEDDPYVDQIHETIEAVYREIGPVKWHLAYQSRGGGPFEWLGPDAGELMEKLSNNGVKDILLVPVGFVSDHVETLYDIDTVYRAKAEGLGINFKRTESLNDHSDFIAALKAIVTEYL